MSLYLAKPITDIASVLQKDAVYCAVGRCSHRLRNEINFDAWITESLEMEASDPRPSSRIIKRRIAWLFGRWFAENLVTQSRENVYGILVNLVQVQGEGSDPVVRLTAATALRDCIAVSTFSLVPRTWLMLIYKHKLPSPSALNYLGFLASYRDPLPPF